MSTTELVLPAPSRVGQATAIEQSRAVAEVQAQVIVAQQCPRDVQEALRQMRDSCNRTSLAEKAFFRFERAGQMISGPSVHLARELARTWGNVQYGTAELRRDDSHKQSEMLAFAWDVQTNSRNSATFIVPHIRDTKKGPKDLTDQRDIYENNANNGARRVREAIFAILPPWFTEEAQQICSKRLSEGDGEPMEVRVANCVDRYAKIGVTVAQLEAKTASKRPQWTPNDLAQLGVIYQSILRNEVRKEDEFEAGVERVTAAEILGGGQPAPNGANGGAAAPSPEPVGADRKPLSKAALSRLQRHLRPLGPEADAMEAVSTLAGRTVITLDELYQDEADRVIAAMEAAVKEAGGDTERAAEQIWATVKGPHSDQPVVEDPPADLFAGEDEQ